MKLKYWSFCLWQLFCCVKESEDITVLKKRILSIEIDLETVKSGKCANKADKANSKSNPIKCLECEFSQNCDLEVHIKVHEQEKWNECEVWGKGFFLVEIENAQEQILNS